MASESFPRLSQTAPSTVPGPLHGVHVPMPDGTRIALDVLLPQAPNVTTFPTVLIMTRYWRGTVGAPLDPWQTFFSERSFAVVIGDVRGTGASFGQWVYHRSRAETLDFTHIMDWVVAQPWSDGRIAGLGGSYLANTADWMVERHHGALKAVVPHGADFDPYADLYFPGGVPNVLMGEQWSLLVKDKDLNVRGLEDGTLSGGVRPVDGAEGPELLQAALKEHRPAPSVWEGLKQITYRDDHPSIWNGSSVMDSGICNFSSTIAASGVPIQNWASWMDAGTASGAIHRFMSLPQSLHVVIGPWSHYGKEACDPLRPDVKNIGLGQFPQKQATLQFIEESFQGLHAREQSRLTYYTCGEGSWKTTTVWPPAQTRYSNLYLGPEQSLQVTPGGDGVDVYKVDFEVGTGPLTRWNTNLKGAPVSYGDRSEVDKRLLCYTSAPLESDVEITGTPIAALFIASTGEDGGIFAYLEAVHPDGKVTYLTEGQLRLMHRAVTSDKQIYPTVGPYHSFLQKDALPTVPGEVADIQFELNPISALVPAGYRIRLAIAGADVDVFARLPASGDPLLHVHRGKKFQSRLVLPLDSQVSGGF